MTKSINLSFFVLFFFASVLHAQTKSASDSMVQFIRKQEITTNDYLIVVEKTDELLNTALTDSDFDTGIYLLFGEIDKTKGKLKLIENSFAENRGNNVHNLQMYRKVLLELKEEAEKHNKQLNVYIDSFSKIKSGISAVRKDPMLQKMVKDTLLRKQFGRELSGLRTKYKATDGLLVKNLNILSLKKKEVLRQKMELSKSMQQVKERLEKSNITLFGNEQPRLWLATKTIAPVKIKGKFEVESRVSDYYISYNSGNLFVLVLLLFFLFRWINGNIKILERKNIKGTLDLFGFRYLNKGILFPIIVIGLNIAIVTNLYAPALYIEFLHLLLLLSVALLFKKEAAKKPLIHWLALIALFMLVCFLDMFVAVSFWQRCAFILVNIAGIIYGLKQLKGLKNEIYIQTFFKWAGFIFISFNFLAIVFNLFGRISIAHTLSLAAIIALTQIVALSLLLKIILEVILLQIYTSRIKRGIENVFDFEILTQNLKTPFVALIFYMWIIGIASNLNLWELLYNSLTSLVSCPISIGSVQFIFGNVLLFFIIVWLAHLLQKYVAYFFGEIDQEDQENINKQQHSKLLVTRLIVLISGYLLAIAASGMPLDKLSIVIGALGVGVGLGLQNVVNNFVSGVILIFDRPIQVGDVIDISSQSGRVKSMGLRSTKIDASNGAEIIIPNGNILSQNITNWTYTNNFKAAEISFSVIGQITQHKIAGIVEETLKSLPLVYSEKEVQIFYTSITDHEYRIALKFWCSIYRTEETVSNVHLALYHNFKNNGIAVKI